MKDILLLVILASFLKTFICYSPKNVITVSPPRNNISPPSIVITLNKPNIKDNYDINEKKKNLEEQNKIEDIISTVQHLIYNIDDYKSEMSDQYTKESLGLNTNIEILNANDENVLNLLLNSKDDTLINEKKKKKTAPIIITYPQPLSEDEIIYYEKYKHLMENKKKTRNLLLKVAHLEKLSQSIKELEDTINIIEKSISKLHIIEEMLEELSYEPTQNEDNNTKKLKTEREYLTEKINVLNKKVEKLKLMNY
ncbi:hypothetical protein PFAG_03855 [Plasmodium falciparum Santa Lucia]|uniref:Uncharacterized protein n=6 Tax=Plasmodium falciparum TaxID=5833 RepID=A0A024W429_PLAFA|nr:hypothetical protein PFFVO_03470 [Plasmodium falciparum Vietnam Oak-Knoll (FVO)]ETW35422.1 hypothetical protein PFTANZ_03841 [Plasmodium falciparum Tanzania (2000708)]ETW41606.1 hypothetical protein PFNF135_04016 [Plasmodium falciparum NF135/5.C10]EUR68680.1 hypothetical protein PFBG_03911 [Plasmodium falciparum 7G8]EUT82479.1 hypothetical protein PFAG_03855 [Plasmodium falciparum Santa Lucia]